MHTVQIDDIVTEMIVKHWIIRI